MINLYIGSNNKTGKLEMRKAFKIISKYSDGFTADRKTGYWKGKEEPSLKVEIDRLSPKKANKLAKELAKELGQDKIGMKNNKSRMRFVS